MFKTLLPLAGLSLVSLSATAGDLTTSAGERLLLSPITTQNAQPLQILGLSAKNVIADEYIVIFKDSTANDTIDSIRQQHNLEQDKAATPVKRFKMLKAISAQLSAKQLNTLAYNSAVKTIEANRVVESVLPWFSPVRLRARPLPVCSSTLVI